MVSGGYSIAKSSYGSGGHWGRSNGSGVSSSWGKNCSGVSESEAMAVSGRAVHLEFRLGRKYFIR